MHARTTITVLAAAGILLTACGGSSDTTSTPAEAYQAFIRASLPCEVAKNTATELGCEAGNGYSAIFFADESWNRGDIAVAYNCRTNPGREVAYGDVWIGLSNEESLLSIPQIADALGGQTGPMGDLCPSELTAREIREDAEEAARQLQQQAAAEAASETAEDARMTPIALENCFSRRNCRGLDLAGADFKSANLSGADFSNADLTGANMSGVRGQNIDFSGANFTQANLQQIYIQTSDFTDANFTDADLNYSTIEDSDLTGADFTDALLPDAISGLGYRNTYTKATCPDGTKADPKDGC